LDFQKSKTHTIINAEQIEHLIEVVFRATEVHKHLSAHRGHAQIGKIEELRGPNRGGILESKSKESTNSLDIVILFNLKVK